MNRMLLYAVLYALFEAVRTAYIYIDMRLALRKMRRRDD